MSRYTVVFAPEAEQHLIELYGYISQKASASVAHRFTLSIADYCAAMDEFPHKGARRDDIRPGLRTVNYRGRKVIAFAVDDVARIVTIIGIFYGGRHVEALLRASDSDKP